MTKPLAFTVVAAAGLSGAAVMVVEVAGAHALAPAFGTGLNAWAAMIIVALGALACGYALGGLAADRWSRHAHRMLPAAMTAAGVSCIADALVWDGLVLRLAGLGPRLGAVAAAAALFLLPFVFLGAVYPLAVKLWTKSVNEIGRRSGLLSAVSAVGSLLGAGLAGFVLVPALTIETVFAGCGTLLLLSAAVVFLAGRGPRPVAAVLVILALWPFLLPARSTPEGLLLRRGSMFGELKVWQSGIMRRLTVAGVCQGFARCDLDAGGPLVSCMPHVSMISAMLSDCLAAEEPRVLIVGLGAGFMPRALETASCETVEIDPAVVDAAERFFAFDRARHPVHVADGRAFLLTNRTEYDAVVIDALRGIDLPYHLLTREFFELAHRRLRPGGMLIVNYHGFLEGKEDKLLRAMEKTLRVVFKKVDICRREEALLAKGPPDESAPDYGNVIFAAHGGGVAVEWPEEQEYGIVQTFLDARPTRVLTDSRNPVALWCAQLELRRRRIERPD